MTNKGFSLKVFYTWGVKGVEDKYDPDFGKVIQWDIPLLDGYDYEFCENTATNQGSHHYKGIINPKIIQSILQYGATHLLVFGWNFQSHLQVLRFFKGKIPVLFRGDSTLLDDSRGFSFRNLFRRNFLHWIYSHID